MVRLYAPEAKKGKEIILSKDQIRHLKVLRLRPGEPIYVFDGKGDEFKGTYTEKVRLGKLNLGEELIPQKESAVKITLGICSPKATRLDFLVEKVSELGVFEIIPLITQRTIVKPRENKIERLQKIAVAACEQSGRSVIPSISAPKTLQKTLSECKYDQIFICHSSGKPLQASFNEKSKRVLLLVGPEGDFTHEELSLAEKKGAEKVSLGSTTLRIETAGISSVAQTIGFYLEQKVYK
ncbi:hypothetical protein COV18_00565 [Candidatus Woesearchaeota archaeon CG10_big_fil_rev_8_21_14_0_10_37_12]|nr:MAG: hypothetical protein COV18_00565 [Candidatus Woesearchaeota archaeon CG10_big_fil_rev_8_21_14_0_10_37_12]